MGEELDRISLRAHAKLNLALSVGPPVDAPGEPTHGYHPICSYMHAIELHDSVEIRTLDSGDSTRLDIAWLEPDRSTRPVDWAPEQDLTHHAHHLMEQACGRELPCEIMVRKSIPAGGGLGGGSSDAASVLVGLNQLFGLGLDTDELQSVAMRFGSDIAYFIDNDHTPPRPAIVSGFGEAIERVEPGHGGQDATLILPSFGCHTGQVYGAFDSICSDSSSDAARTRALVASAALQEEGIFNDLTRPAMMVQPELEGLRDSLQDRLGRAVHMSGSGSTLFVLGRIDTGLVQEVSPECRVIHSRLC